MIKHIWFDFSDTLAKINKDVHNKLRYTTYSELVKKPLNDELIKEFEEMLKKHTSNSGIFRALGKPASFWAERVNSSNPELIYSLAHENVPETLKKLKAIVPISLFTNIKPEKILPAIGISMELFTHAIQAGMVKEPKPNLEGFYKIIEITKEPAENILYVGDSIEKDIKPAKAVGMKTCLIWGVSSEADYSVTKFEELLNIVK